MTNFETSFFELLVQEYNIHGWWVGELNGTVGIVPKDFLQPAYILWAATGIQRHSLSVSIMDHNCGLIHKKHPPVLIQIATEVHFSRWPAVYGICWQREVLQKAVSGPQWWILETQQKPDCCIRCSIEETDSLIVRKAYFKMNSALLMCNFLIFHLSFAGLLPTHPDIFRRQTMVHYVNSYFSPFQTRNIILYP